jgi:hypothetical protein
LDLFFSRRIPHFTNVVLVESGPRHLFDQFIGDLYSLHGQNIRVDLVTCFAGKPETFRETNGKVYRVRDYGGWQGAKSLALELRGNRTSVLGIICAGVPVMAKWKWMLAAALRAKVFVMNENGDYFWVDYSNWKVMLHFMAFRAGMTGDNSIWLPLRLAVFPFGIAAFALFAAWIHLRMWMRHKLRGQTA